MKTVAMEAPVPEDDALARMVSLADAEGLLQAGSLERFVDGLRERGRIILEGRVLPLERRVEALEKENTWRRAEQARTTAAHDRLLEHHRAALAEEVAHRMSEIEARDAEIRRWREEHARASAAHDRLLEHHRAVLAGVAESLTAVISWLPWSYRRARASLARLAATLRQDTP